MKIFSWFQNHRRAMVVACGIGLIIWVALISACEPLPPPPLPPGASLATATPKPTATLVPAQLTIQQVYTTSKHANTYIEGTANECVRCHAPMNWIPTAPEDMPATCAACKFNIKPPKPVEKADWKNIGCEQCHKTDDKGAVTKQVAWLNAAIAVFDPSSNPYEAVKTNTELCERCHRDSYKVDLGTTAHKDKGCTDCHNAHSTKATCADCHKTLTEVPGHDKAHANVPCATCHDASKMKVAPTPDKKTWLTYKLQDPRGKPGDYAVISHNFQKKADCARCHSANNPWGLKPVTP
jgi:hypothetical protein